MKHYLMSYYSYFIGNNMEDDFNSIEKEIIKSLKKEIHSRDDVERGLAYYKMLFNPVLDLAEKAIKQYIKVIKAAGTENVPEDTIVYRIVELFESALMDRLKGVANG